MAEYWYQRAEGDEVEGPCTGARLKALADAGDITVNSMITADGTTWHRAGRVAKLFPPAPAAAPAQAAPALRPAPPRAVPPTARMPAAAAPPVSRPAEAPVPHYAPAQYAAAPQYASPPAPMYAPPPVAAPPLTHAAPAQRSVAVGWVGKPRGTAPFLLLSLLLMASNITAGVLFYNEITSHRLDFTIPVIVFLASFVIGIGTLVYWMVLLFAVHRDMMNFTGSTYPVSPAKAVGFCFIPAFSAFWIVYMPYKLLSEVRMHLRERGSQASPGLVMAFQIASIPLGILIAPGAAAVMYALSIMQIQKGLNALWRQGA